MKTIVAIFDDPRAAERAAYELLEHGIAVDHINAVYPVAPEVDPMRTAAHHTGLGRLLVDAGFLEVPNVGTVLAVGPRLGPMAFPHDPLGTGIAALPRRLDRVGVPPIDAEGYADAVGRGAALIVLTVYEAYVHDASEILARHEPIDPDEIDPDDNFVAPTLAPDPAVPPPSPVPAVGSLP